MAKISIEKATAEAGSGISVITASRCDVWRRITCVLLGELWRTRRVARRIWRAAHLSTARVSAQGRVGAKRGVAAAWQRKRKKKHETNM